MLVTRFLLDRAEELEVDRDKIILLGSSSGAFPCLQCDMERSLGSEMARIPSCENSGGKRPRTVSCISSTRATPWLRAI